MKSSKLIRILRGLSKTEFKKFGDFLKSPYYNKSEKVIQLYDFLKDNYSEYEVDNITKESIAEYVYPETEYDEQKIRTLVSDFIKLIEKFLIVIEDEKNEVYQKLQLIRALNDRNISQSFSMVLKEALEMQKTEFNRDEDYYYNQMYLELESLNYKFKRDETFDREDYNKITSNIDLFFIITKLDMLHNVSIHEKNIKPDSNFNEWMYDEIIQYIEKNISLMKKEHPIIYMKYLILMSILNPDEEKYYESLKKYFTINWKKFNIFTREYVFGSLENYAVDRYNKGFLKFKNDRFFIYEFIEDNNILYYGNLISHIDFLNSITSALAVDEVVWAEKFYDKYKDKILPELKEDVLNLSLARIYYSKKEYEKAIMILNRISYKKYSFYLRSKTILAQIYYDNKDYEPTGYLIDAAKHYLNRKRGKMSVSEYDMFRNFFVFLGRLLNLSKEDKYFFKKELEKKSNIVNKEWLLDKTREFGKKS